MDRVLKVDNFAINSLNDGFLLDEIPSGKGINVSLYLNNLGIKSQIISFMGSNFENIFHEFLAENGIDFTFIKVEGKIRSNITIIDPPNNSHTHIKMKGFKLKEVEQTSIQSYYTKKCKSGDIIIFSGSYPEGFDFDLFNQSLSLLNENRVLIFIDNDGNNLKKIKNTSSFFIKPNKDELKAFMGFEPSSFEELVNMLWEYISCAGGKMIVTLGEDGLLYCDQKEMWHCVLKVEKVISSVGCGDAVLAGFLYGFSQNLSVLDSLKYAISAAVDKLSNHSVGKIDKNNVESLVNQVIYKKVY